MATQIVPISDFHVRQADVLTKLDNGPAILAQQAGGDSCFRYGMGQDGC